jgi:aryl-alcohol dehydrogenase-like predicted oxidoreductase
VQLRHFPHYRSAASEKPAKQSRASASALVPAFCSNPDEDAAQALSERAFNLGVNYFDTAGSYTRRPLERLSEKRLGEFSKKRRNEIFLATKIDPRDRDGKLP